MCPSRVENQGWSSGFLVERVPYRWVASISGHPHLEVQHEALSVRVVLRNVHCEWGVFLIIRCLLTPLLTLLFSLIHSCPLPHLYLSSFVTISRTELFLLSPGFCPLPNCTLFVLLMLLCWYQHILLKDNSISLQVMGQKISPDIHDDSG